MVATTVQYYYHKAPLQLSSGMVLPSYHLAYHTYGTLNENGSNVIWVFHALTANSAVHEWWPNLIGEHKLFDTKKYFVVCVNKPGSCYGSIAPNSIDDSTQKVYGHQFPIFTIKDIVQSYQPLVQYLGIKEIAVAIGGSTGGMQLLQWAAIQPKLFKHIIPIATNAVASPWIVAFNTAQRMAIESDDSFFTDEINGGKKGLAAARSIAMLSYRHYNGYAISQPITKTITPYENSFFAADSYQRYQGKKLSNRFNAICYYRLTQSMDSHNINEAALKNITAKTTVISIDNDVLYPAAEQKYLADTLTNAELYTIHSDFGHDGFLVEETTLIKILEKKLK
jgi:homoserine O-acetyltransferase/O-succinyltransferase